MHRIHRTQLAATITLSALLVGAGVTAQLPANHLAVGTAPGNNVGTSGLFYVSLEDGTTTRVTGLPSRFEQSSGLSGGVRSVLRRPDERMILGTGATGGGTLSLTMLTLSGAAVVSTVQLTIGTVPLGWWFLTSDLSLMPDGKRALFGTPDNIQGQMAGHRLGIADLDASPPTLTPIPLNGVLLGTFIYGIEMSRDGRTAFVLTGMGNSNWRPLRLYMVDIQTGNLALLRREDLRDMWKMQLHGSTLYVSLTDYFSAAPRPTEILEFQITGWGQATVTTHPLATNEGVYSVTSDHATGQTVMLSTHYQTRATPNPRTVFLADHRSGAVSLLASPPAGGWGEIWDMEVHSAVEPYGATPQEHEVGFRTFPNPGGSPKAGNAGFSLTLETTVVAANPPSAFLLGVRPLDVPVVGTRLLVEPMVALPVTSPTPTQPTRVPLPISASFPPGTELRAQWVMCESGSCRGSRGLKFVTQ